MSRRVRCGVVGCGTVAFEQYFPAIKREGELTATCDLVEERARLAKERFGAKRYYTDYDEMLKDAEVEAVFITTGMATHGRFVIKAAEAGKHLLTQKPLATNMKEADEAVRAVRRAGVKALVEPNVNSPSILEAKQLIDDGALGRVFWFASMRLEGEGPPFGEETFFTRAAGGPMFDSGVYAISHLTTLLGPVAKVTGMAALSRPQRIIKSGEQHTKALETRKHIWVRGTKRITMTAMDNTLTLMEMKKGALGCLVSNWCTFHEGREFLVTQTGTEIYGEDGSLFLAPGDIPRRFAYVSSKREFQPDGSQAATETTKHFPRWHYYSNSTRNLLDAIVNDTDPAPNIEYGRHISEVMIKSLESSRTGKTLEIVSAV